MKKIEWTTELIEFDSVAELESADMDLLEKARSAAALAYAPYSGFCVGAAVLMENGQIITGSNQENAAYPSGLCAERVAVFAASSRFPGIPVKAMAITCSSATSEPLTPCGACRQVLAEYETLHNNSIKLVLSGSAGKVWVVQGMNALLPLAFRAKDLPKK